MNTFKQKLNILKDAIIRGGDLQQNQQKLFDTLDSMTDDEKDYLFHKKRADEAEIEIKNLKKQLEEAHDIIENEKKPMALKDIEKYDVVNFYKFFRTEDGKLIKDDLYIDEEMMRYKNPYYDWREGSAFDRNLAKNKNYYRDYQKKFIEDWSVSAQELVILYYGVGSGKTMIAVNCAEQYHEITQNSHVYFIVPASLVLGTIKEMFDRGIDAKRKNSKGEFIYYFVSYQQMLRSNFDFKENSLLIIDEAHNLRNIRADEISEKKSARKYEKTGNYSLVGNKLSEKLILSSSKFLRTIFMTGTLFVNSSEDIEALMAIGYKKQPLLEIDRTKYESLIQSNEEFKTYYEGLISFYRIPSDYPTIPQKRFEFVPIVDKTLEFDIPWVSKTGKTMKEPYYMISRNQAINKKIDWIIKFLKKNKNQKTLIYSQFLDKSILPLKEALEKNGFKFGFISGELNQVQKLNVVKQYNDNEINILIFTLSIKEGISFKETNNIIVFQPYWNYAIMEQILARGIRLNSHAKGNKDTINLYFLVGVRDKENSKDWFNRADKIMNEDIKKLVFPIKIDKKDPTIKTKDMKEISNSYSSRDIDLYNRMFKKQEEINIFEKRMLDLPRFEEVNNNENNEFIEDYKTKLYELEQENDNKPISNKEAILLKKRMYKEYYDKKIKEIDSRILRFDKDVRYRENRNPNLEEKASSERFGDKTSQIKNLIKQKASLGDFLELFNISKKDITAFQSNFTPPKEIQLVIDQSGLKDDKRDNIKILEPTAGIGNFIPELLACPNKQNFMIDCNEYVNAYYQIGKTMYEDIDNVKWYNSDFWIYQNKYNYDYILGNPPFNLAHQILQKITYKAEKDQPAPEPTYKKVDVRLFDIHFVSKAYNMLNNDGVLSMIISDRFQRDKSQVFSIFNLYLEDMKKIDPSSVKIVKSGEFKEDKGVSKEMTTSFGMVCITLKKLKDFNIDLDSNKRITKMAMTQNEGKNEKEQKELIKDLKKGVIKKPRAVNLEKKRAKDMKEEDELEKEFNKKVNPIDEFKQLQDMSKTSKPKTTKKKPLEEFKELQQPKNDFVVDVRTNGDKIVKLMRKIAKEKGIKLQIPIMVSSNSEKLEKELNRFLKNMKITKEEFINKI